MPLGLLFHDSQECAYLIDKAYYKTSKQVPKEEHVVKVGQNNLHLSPQPQTAAKQFCMVGESLHFRFFKTFRSVKAFTSVF